MERAVILVNHKVEHRYCREGVQTRRSDICLIAARFDFFPLQIYRLSHGDLIRRPYEPLLLIKEPERVVISLVRRRALKRAVRRPWGGSYTIY